jgi:hypothetical protein
MEEKQQVGNITFAPGFTNKDYPHGLAGCSVDEQIQAFENMYTVWILPFAQKLVEMPDSGFAVLTLLNAYPDMIAQLHGKSRKFEDRYKAGLLLVFPEIADRETDRICNHLYAYLRSGLAHMSFTSVGIMLSEDFLDPIVIRSVPNGLLLIINPRSWFERIKRHFTDYISELRKPENHQLRQAFSQRFSKSF